MKVILIIFMINLYCAIVKASGGDSSPIYRNCLNSCLKSNCSEGGLIFKPNVGYQQELFCRLLLWSCHDECRYTCMWVASQALIEKGYSVPKFHGKWPFVRWMGMQEPAAAIASILNLVTHVYMNIKMRHTVNSRDVSDVTFWNLFTAVCVHAWMWSTIFHMRDTPFTEFMDYSCALSMVLALFIAAIIRILRNHSMAKYCILSSTVIYFGNHVRYLHSGRVDYSYNMAVNIVFGATGALLWLSWALHRYMREGVRYVSSLFLFNALSAVAISLELLDFPPLLRAFDAHALWHFATVPLPLIFYRFVIDDVKHMKYSPITSKQYLKVP